MASDVESNTLYLWNDSESQNNFIYYLLGGFLIIFVLCFLVTRTLRRKEPNVMVLTSLEDDCFETEPHTYYVVVVSTSYLPGSTCNRNIKVFIQLEGEHGNTPYIRLKTNYAGQNILQRGVTDLFLVKVREKIGKIEGVVFVMSTGAEKRITWRVRCVKLYNPYTEVTMFPSIKIMVIESSVEFQNDQWHMKESRYHTLGRSLIQYHQWLSVPNTKVRYGAYTETVNILMIFTAFGILLVSSLIAYILSDTNDNPDLFEVSALPLLLGSFCSAISTFIITSAIELQMHFVACREKDVGLVYSMVRKGRDVKGRTTDKFYFEDQSMKRSMNAQRFQMITSDKFFFEDKSVYPPTQETCCIDLEETASSVSGYGRLLSLWNSLDWINIKRKIAKSFSDLLIGKRTPNTAEFDRQASLRTLYKSCQEIDQDFMNEMRKRHYKQFVPSHAKHINEILHTLFPDIDAPTDDITKKQEEPVPSQSKETKEQPVSYKLSQRRGTLYRSCIDFDTAKDSIAKKYKQPLPSQSKQASAKSYKSERDIDKLKEDITKKQKQSVPTKGKLFKSVIEMDTSETDIAKKGKQSISSLSKSAHGTLLKSISSDKWSKSSQSKQASGKPSKFDMDIVAFKDETRTKQEQSVPLSKQMKRKPCKPVTEMETSDDDKSKLTGGLGVSESSFTDRATFIEDIRRKPEQSVSDQSKLGKETPFKPCLEIDMSEDNFVKKRQQYASAQITQTNNVTFKSVIDLPGGIHKSKSDIEISSSVADYLSLDFQVTVGRIVIADTLSADKRTHDQKSKSLEDIYLDEFTGHRGTDLLTYIGELALEQNKLVEMDSDLSDSSLDEISPETASRSSHVFVSVPGSSSEESLSTDCFNTRSSHYVIDIPSPFWESCSNTATESQRFNFDNACGTHIIPERYRPRDHYKKADSATFDAELSNKQKEQKKLQTGRGNKVPQDSSPIIAGYCPSGVSYDEYKDKLLEPVFYKINLTTGLPPNQKLIDVVVKKTREKPNVGLRKESSMVIDIHLGDKDLEKMQESDIDASKDDITKKQEESVPSQSKEEPYNYVEKMDTSKDNNTKKHKEPASYHLGHRRGTPCKSFIDFDTSKVEIAKKCEQPLHSQSKQTNSYKSVMDVGTSKEHITKKHLKQYVPAISQHSKGKPKKSVMEMDTSEDDSAKKHQHLVSLSKLTNGTLLKSISNMDTSEEDIMKKHEQSVQSLHAFPEFKPASEMLFTSCTGKDAAINDITKTQKLSVPSLSKQTRAKAYKADTKIDTSEDDITWKHQQSVSQSKPTGVLDLYESFTDRSTFKEDIGRKHEQYVSDQLNQGRKTPCKFGIEIDMSLDDSMKKCQQDASFELKQMDSLTFKSIRNLPIEICRSVSDTQASLSVADYFSLDFQATIGDVELSVIPANDKEMHDRKFKPFEVIYLDEFISHRGIDMLTYIEELVLGKKSLFDMDSDLSDSSLDEISESSTSDNNETKSSSSDVFVSVSGSFSKQWSSTGCFNTRSSHYVIDIPSPFWELYSNTAAGVHQAVTFDTATQQDEAKRKVTQTETSRSISDLADESIRAQLKPIDLDQLLQSMWNGIRTGITWSYISVFEKQRDLQLWSRSHIESMACTLKNFKKQAENGNLLFSTAFDQGKVWFKDYLTELCVVLGWNLNRKNPDGVWQELEKNMSHVFGMASEAVCKTLKGTCQLLLHRDTVTLADLLLKSHEVMTGIEANSISIVPVERDFRRAHVKPDLSSELDQIYRTIAHTIFIEAVRLGFREQRVPWNLFLKIFRKKNVEIFEEYVRKITSLLIYSSETIVKEYDGESFMIKALCCYITRLAKEELWKEYQDIQLVLTDMLFKQTTLDVLKKLAKSTTLTICKQVEELLRQKWIIQGYNPSKRGEIALAQALLCAREMGEDANGNKSNNNKDVFEVSCGINKVPTQHAKLVTYLQFKRVETGLAACLLAMIQLEANDLVIDCLQEYLSQQLSGWNKKQGTGAQMDNWKKQFIAFVAESISVKLNLKEEEFARRDYCQNLLDAVLETESLKHDFFMQTTLPQTKGNQRIKTSPRTEADKIEKVSEQLLAQGSDRIESTCITEMINELKPIRKYMKFFRMIEDLRGRITKENYLARIKKEQQLFIQIQLQNVVDSFYILYDDEVTPKIDRTVLYQLEYDTMGDSRKPLPPTLKIVLMILICLMLAFSEVYTYLVAGQLSTTQVKEWFCYFSLSIVKFGFVFEVIKALLFGMFFASSTY